MSELLIVDAANVIGSRPDGWWRDRAAAAGRLVTDLERLGSAGDVVVVLEGAARAGVEPTSGDGLSVVHAGGSGDDEIVHLVASARERDRTAVTVVTSDRELRRRVEGLGAHTHGPGWLWRQLS